MWIIERHMPDGYVDTLPYRFSTYDKAIEYASILYNAEYNSMMEYEHTEKGICITHPSKNELPTYHVCKVKQMNKVKVKVKKVGGKS